MTEEKVFISLQCRDCEQDQCVFCPNGTYLYNKEGCTRKVTDEVAARFNHFNEEVLPFWKTYSPQQIKESYCQHIDFLFNEIYSAPIGQKLDKNGKVSLSKS